MKRPSIKLLNTDKSHNRHLTVRERDILLYSKPPQVKRVSSRRAKTETYQLLPEVISKRSMHEASPPSITSREMRINAGVEDGNRAHVRAKLKAHKGFRWRVQLKEKIEEDGLVFTDERDA